MKKTYTTPQVEVFRVIVKQLIALSMKDGEANPNATVYAPEYNRGGNAGRSDKSSIWDHEW